MGVCVMIRRQERLRDRPRLSERLGPGVGSWWRPRGVHGPCSTREPRAAPCSLCPCGRPSHRKTQELSALSLIPDFQGRASLVGPACPRGWDRVKHGFWDCPPSWWVVKGHCEPDAPSKPCMLLTHVHTPICVQRGVGKN